MSETVLKLPTVEGRDSIRGPTQPQMLFLYMATMTIILSAEVSGWVPYIRWINSMPYVALCISVFELNRYLIVVQPQTVLPLYTNLIPMAFLIVVSREAHILIALIFFSGTLVIQMQCGSPQLALHIRIYTLAYTTIYICCMMFMNAFYTDARGDSTWAGRKLDPEVNWGQETTFALAMFAIGVGFALLERFINTYSRVLAERREHIKDLDKARRELEKEVQRSGKAEKENLDMDAPIEKVLSTLRKLKSNMTQPDMVDDIEWITKVLNSNQNLYAPSLAPKIRAHSHGGTGGADGVDETTDGGAAGDGGGGGGVDDEINAWVFSELSRSVKVDNSIGGQGGGVADDSMIRSNARVLEDVTDDGLIESAMQAQLADLENWDFNVFEVARLSRGRPLFFVGQALFQAHDSLRKCDVDDVKMRSALGVIESGYRVQNPYHNSIHAADVMHAMHFFISRCGFASYLSDLEIFAALVAAAIHDYDHPGLNNAFQVRTETPRAVLYNDRSVLENHHLAAAFLQLRKEQNNIFASFSGDVRRNLRSIIIEMVLATDLSVHFDVLSKFRARLSAEDGLMAENPEDRSLLLQIGLKCADVSNGAKPENLAHMWTMRIVEEFFRQGDAEARRSLPISPFMDRTKPQSIPKSQMGFIDFIVRPLFETTLLAFPAFKPLVKHIDDNHEMWARSDDATYERFLPSAKLPAVAGTRANRTTATPALLLGPGGGPPPAESDVDENESHIVDV